MNKIITYVAIGFLVPIISYSIGYFNGAISIESAELLIKYETYFVAFGTAILGFGGIMFQLQQNEKSRKIQAQHHEDIRNDQAERHEDNRAQVVQEQENKRIQELEDRKEAVDEKLKSIAAIILIEIEANSNRLSQTVKKIREQNIYSEPYNFLNDSYLTHKKDFVIFEPHIIYGIHLFYESKYQIDLHIANGLPTCDNYVPLEKLPEDMQITITQALTSMDLTLTKAGYIQKKLAKICGLSFLETVHDPQ